MSYQGDNRGSGRAVSHGSVADAVQTIRDYIVKYPKSGDAPQEVYDQLAAVENGASTVRVYRATPGGSINEGDWVFLSREQADRFSRSLFSGKRKKGYRVLIQELPVSRVHWTGKNLEFMKVGK